MANLEYHMRKLNQITDKKLTATTKIWTQNHEVITAEIWQRLRETRELKYCGEPVGEWLQLRIMNTGEWVELMTRQEGTI